VHHATDMVFDAMLQAVESLQLVNRAPTNLDQALAMLSGHESQKMAAEFLVDYMQEMEDPMVLVRVANTIMGLVFKKWHHVPSLIGLVELIEDISIVTRHMCPFPEVELFEFLAEMLKRYRNNLDIVLAICSVVSLFSDDKDDALALFDLGVASHLILALHNHIGSLKLCQVICYTLANLFALRGPEAGKHAVLFIVYDGAAFALVDAMHLHRHDLTVQSQGINALVNLFLNPPDMALREELLLNQDKEYVIYEGLGDALLGVLKWHFTEDALLGTTLRFISELAKSAKNKTIFLDLGAVNVIRSVQMRNQKAANDAVEVLLL